MGQDRLLANELAEGQRPRRRRWPWTFAILLVLLAVVASGCGGGTHPKAFPAVDPTTVVDSGVWRDTTWRLLSDPSGPERFCARFDWLQSDGSAVDQFGRVCGPEPKASFGIQTVAKLAFRQGDGGRVGVFSAVVAPSLDEVTLKFSDATSEQAHLNGNHLVLFFENKTVVEVAAMGRDGSYANCRPQVLQGDPPDFVDRLCYRFGRHKPG